MFRDHLLKVTVVILSHCISVLVQLYSIYMQSNYMQFLRKIAKSCHPKIFQLYAGFWIKFLF